MGNNRIDMFEPFPKVARLSRQLMVVTEKIDGTNAQIFIEPRLAAEHPIKHERFFYKNPYDNIEYYVRAGSRKHWVEPENDNFGFARWVYANLDELFKLGPGRHFGEWWGVGIQRGYGLAEKRFTLFNVGRWDYSLPERTPPTIVSVVPVLTTGPFNPRLIDEALNILRTKGSRIVPGYLNPEGVCIYVAGQLFKKTLGPEEERGKDEAAQVQNRQNDSTSSPTN